MHICHDLDGKILPHDSRFMFLSVYLVVNQTRVLQQGFITPFSGAGDAGGRCAKELVG